MTAFVFVHPKPEAVIPTEQAEGIFVNLCHVAKIKPLKEGSTLIFTDGTGIDVTESPLTILRHCAVENP